ncbi:MAG: preprotein translocase subunit YajC [Planctomycetota bacterium]
MFFASAAPLFFAAIDPSLMMWVVIAAIFIFVVVLPARKEKKAKEEMLAKLAKGDRVLLQCGLIGKIAQLRGTDVVVIEADGAKLSFLRTSVVGLYVQKDEGGKNSAAS